MIEIFKKSFITLLFSIIIYIFLSNPSLIINSVNKGINIFVRNVLPSLFSFFVLTDILAYFNYFDNLKKIIRFKYSDIFVVSLISGLPANAKYVRDLLNNKMISIHDASIVMSSTYFPNPMFVLGVVSVFLNSFTSSIKILLICYLSNFIVYLFNYKSLSNNNSFNKESKTSFFNLLRESIINNSNNLIVIMGSIILFSVITSILNNYLNLSDITTSILNSVMEITNGINLLSKLNINTKHIYILIIGALNFSGLSVLIQSFGILSPYKLNLKIFFINKLLVVLVGILIGVIAL